MRRSCDRRDQLSRGGCDVRMTSCGRLSHRTRCCTTPSGGGRTDRVHCPPRHPRDRPPVAVGRHNHHSARPALRAPGARTQPPPRRPRTGAPAETALEPSLPHAPPPAAPRPRSDTNRHDHRMRVTGGRDSSSVGHRPCPAASTRKPGRSRVRAMDVRYDRTYHGHPRSPPPVRTRRCSSVPWRAIVFPS
jgi:hypothetical protein